MDSNVPDSLANLSLQDMMKDANEETQVVAKAPVIDSMMLVANDTLYKVVMPTKEVEGRTVTEFNLGKDVTELASEQEIGKILQYNNGSTKIVDTDHMYIPEGMSKEDSLEFMRKIGSDLMLQGRLNNDNQEELELGRRLITYANRMGLTEEQGAVRTDIEDWQKGLPGANEYTAQEIQSVFNALAEREPAMQGEKMRQVFEYDLMQANYEIQKREEMKPFLQAFSRHVKKDREASAEYQLASAGIASEHEVGKILQYNAGTIKIADTNSMYIPEHMSKEQSLEFMNKMASKIVEQGISENNQDMINVGKKLVSYAKRMEIPRETEAYRSHKEMGIPAFGDAYGKEEIQSVFNAIAEREDCLKTASALKMFDESLLSFEKDLKVRQEMQPLMHAYSQRIARDLDHSPMHEFYSTFNNVEEAKQYARENGPRKTITRFSAEENARMGDQIGQETYRVYGSIAPKPYVIESSSKAIGEQLALDSIISGYKRDGSRGYGFNHDRDNQGQLVVGLTNGTYEKAGHSIGKLEGQEKVAFEIPKFKFERKGQANLKFSAGKALEEEHTNGMG